MSFAFIFPGQGSQKVGMGHALYKDSTAAKAVFDEVDEALGEPLSKIIFEGEQDTLTLTQNAQPALMAVSMAVIKVLEQEFDISVKDHAKFAAGHSLGEYSALATAGAFSVSQAAKLLRLRGKSMQEAVPVGKGAMAALLGIDLDGAIALSVKASEKGGVCEAANDNAPGQIVISGSKEAVERAVELASEYGARRAVMLDVSAPFHSSLMAPAQEIMAEALGKADINDPIVPIVANVEANIITSADQVRDCLTRQVTGRVRWRETVSFMAQNGINTLCEIGAGRVLSGMTRRIERDLNGLNAETMEEIEGLAKALKGNRA